MTYHGNAGLGAMTGDGWNEPEYSEYRENMLALNEYMVNACGSPPRCNSATATALRDEWIEWYDSLGYVDYYYDCASLPCVHWDEARMIRDEFQRANAATPEELEQVIYVQETGMTTEEMMGQPSRKTSEGTYGDTPKEPPLVPPKHLLLGAALFAGGAYIHFAFLRPFSKASKRVAERIA